MIHWNPQASLQWIPLGDSAESALRVDNAVLNLQQIRTACASLAFSSDAGSFYPGIRAMMPRPYAQAVLEAVYPLLQHLLQPPAHFRLQPRQLFFSLLTSQPQTLQPAQRLPHFDTPSAYHAAILHHLAPGPHGGTAFYRHNASGLCRISKDNQTLYFSSLNQQLAQKPLPLQYPSTDCDGFTLLKVIAHRPNRLLIYPGSVLHSALVDPATDLSADPLQGRLTANLFVEFIDPESAVM